MNLSIVIPAHNEEANIPLMVQELGPVLDALGPGGAEVIFVDDASTDGTAAALRLIQDPRYKIIQFSKRGMKCGAVHRGIQEAQGEFVALLDADLQVKPGEIPKLMAEFKNERTGGVNGWRRDRKAGFLKTVSSKIGNTLNNFVFGLNLRDNNSPLRIYRAKAVKKIKYFKHLHRFLSPLLKFQGYEIIEVPVGHYPRIHGKSKYGLHNRVFGNLWRLIRVRLAPARHFL